MKKTLLYISLLAGLSLGTSCDDFLDIEPLNEIVSDNYWTEKSDVQSVIYSCYSGMEATDVLQRLFVWGEMRSDNITTSNSAPWAVQQIIAENILETNTWVRWQSLYQVINRCNTVIYFAPSVVEKDPNYTESEMKANIAEATWLRTFCYFTLMRAFRDVPYTTKPSLNDNDIEGDYRLAPTPFDVMLDTLIADMESVKDDALKLYPEESGTGLAANTSRVTTCAMYALLADLYLWKQDYQKCIEYCDLVLEYKMERYEELKVEEPEEAADIDLYFNKYPLLMEQPGGNTVGSAYNAIFGIGNSFESIMELYFQNNQSLTNQLVSSFYGTSSNIGSCCAYAELMTGVYEGNGSTFKPTDYRAAENIQDMGSQYAIRKYLRQTVAITPSRQSGTAPTTSASLRSTNYANWILYRLTDVMLMKAEAEIELGSTEQMDDAFELISAVYNRANNLSETSTDCLKKDDYLGRAMMRQLVLDERHRELMFEGKRWFDLVRYCLRVGNNTALIEAVIGKQREKQSATRVKLSSTDALFWPYAESELDANPHLTQNPAYITSETSEK
ncbi:MAG: RagB/SusD family nutrient uptake outer membrane protein [Bacteroidales bacterium]|nr:RagB/SusD family nutrient uptake outer membrane protein [Bacteroidales bacterium]